MGKDFKREDMSEDEAFAEGQREALARVDPRSVDHQTWLPCVGGPQDGRLFRVPTWMLRSREGSGEKPEMAFPASPSGLENHKPLEQRMYATYRLERSSRILRYVRTHRLGG